VSRGVTFMKPDPHALVADIERVMDPYTDRAKERSAKELHGWPEGLSPNEPALRFGTETVPIREWSLGMPRTDSSVEFLIMCCREGGVTRVRDANGNDRDNFSPGREDRFALSSDGRLWLGSARVLRVQRQIGPSFLETLEIDLMTVGPVTMR
jgi:hypothetical protein